MGEQKKKKTTKKVVAPKKPAVKKRIVRRAAKKVVVKKTTVRQSVRLAPAVTTVPRPLPVDPLLHQPLRRTRPDDRMSLRRHIVSAFSLVAISVVALSVIAGFAQVTFMNIDSMNTSSTALMKPVATESRFFPSVAGELTVTMPMTWTITAEGDNTITYTHTTATAATMTMTVQTNETDNIFTWLQAHQPDYTNAIVVESDAAVSALRGVTVTAETLDGVPLHVIYIPIQKNLGERYIITIRAQVPSDEAGLFVQQAFDSVLENFGVSEVGTPMVSG